MKNLVLATLVLTAACGAIAQNAPHAVAPRAKVAALCDSCGVVQQVRQEKRKGEGGAAGVVGGAVVGGLLGNQIGGGSGRTLATVGGAVAGGFAGNEVQKRVTSRTVWVTRVKMKNGSIRSFEQEARPAWAAGQAVRVHNNRTLIRL